jgi:hypothetical protein
MKPLFQRIISKPYQNDKNDLTPSPPLLDGMGVVKPQIGFPAVFQGKPEIQTNGFYMSNMQISVRFRRETRQNGTVFTLAQVCLDYILDKI